MKTLNLKPAHGRHFLLVCLLLSNSVFLFAQRENYDDVLYTPSKDKKSTYQEPKRYVDTTIHVQSTENRETIEHTSPDGMTKSATQTDDKGNTYITNNYNGSYTNYSEDDYYDYAYAARIKRFYSPYSGWSYYNDYYTNAYWYTYDPYYWGVSIYLGYNWWYPSWHYYSPRYYAGWGWGAYGYPWYGGGAYWAGYNYGYWNGYWNGYYAANCYYNSYDWNSYYYGRPVYYGARTAGSRGTTSGYRSNNSFSARSGMVSNSRSNEFMRSSSGRNTSTALTRDNRTFGERYETSALTRGTSTKRNPATNAGRNDYNRSIPNAADRNTATNNSRTTYDKPSSNNPSFERRGGVDINPNAATINRGATVNRTSPNKSTPSTSRGIYNKPTTEQTHINDRTVPVSTRQSTNNNYSTPNREQNRYTSPTPNSSSRSNYNSGWTENNNSRYSAPARTSTPSSTPSSVSPSRSSSPSPANTGGSRGGSTSGGNSGGRSSGGRR